MLRTWTQAQSLCLKSKHSYPLRAIFPSPDFNPRGSKQMYKWERLVHKSWVLGQVTEMESSPSGPLSPVHNWTERVLPWTPWRYGWRTDVIVSVTLPKCWHSHSSKWVKTAMYITSLLGTADGGSPSLLNMEKLDDQPSLHSHELSSPPPCHLP